MRSTEIEAVQSKRREKTEQDMGTGPLHLVFDSGNTSQTMFKLIIISELMKTGLL